MARAPVLNAPSAESAQRRRVAIGIMHLAKGLEFKAVAVMACDDEVLLRIPT